MKISQVLARAAKLVERDGWCQGFMRVRNENGKIIGRCTFGAMQDGGEEAPLPALMFLEDFLALESYVGPWNDAPDRTGPEVACWLASAAEYAKVLGK